MLHQPQDIVRGKYRILDILGKGSSGITYRVEDIVTQQHIALKVLSLRRLKDWKQIELFEREASVLAKLEHPNIPKYLDYFQIDTPEDRAFYIAQAIAPGKSLTEWVESGWRSNEREIKQIAQQLLSVLIYIHSLDPPIIHRDIKPDNIIRDRQGKIHLVDFGAVQNVYHNTLMPGSTVVGSYGYMSPEQFRGKAVPATDLYSLGATLLYLLTHRSPAELPQDTLKLDFRASVDISEEFGDWLDKMLEPSLDYRYTSAKEALDVLQQKRRSGFRKRKISGRTIILSTIFLWLSIVGVKNHWRIFSFFGYYPINICGDLAIMQRYLFFGGDANIAKPTDSTESKFLLECFARTSDADVPHSSLREKLDRKNKTIYDNILFFEAVEQGNSDRIREILSSLKIDVNVTSDRKKQTALQIAVSRNDLQLTKLLIGNGADIRDEKIVLLAISQGNLNIVQLLIDHGAELNINDEWRLVEAVAKQVIADNIALIKLLNENNFNFTNYFLFEDIGQQIYWASPQLREKCKGQKNYNYRRYKRCIEDLSQIAKSYISNDMADLLESINK